MLEAVRKRLIEAENRIKANIVRLGTVASGSLLKSVQVKEEGNKIFIEINQYAKYLEEGRKPTVNGGDGAVLRAIKQWTKYKGLPPESAYAISQKIHKEGYEAKGDIYSAELERLKKEIPELARKSFKGFVQQVFTGKYKAKNIDVKRI
jgi:hypothetical protein